MFPFFFTFFFFLFHDNLSIFVCVCVCVCVKLLASPVNALSLDKSKCLPFEEELTLFQTTILDSSELNAFADDNFKFDENGRQISKWVTSNFSFSHSVFKRLVLQTL